MPTYLRMELEKVSISQYDPSANDSFNFDLQGAARAAGTSDIGEIAITSCPVGELGNNAATDGARVPPHTPEWTDLNSADPGVSLPPFDDWTI